MSRTRNTFTASRAALMAGTSITMVMMMSGTAFAQQADEDTLEMEELVVTGTRRVIQDSIALKRNNVQIVDGLSADEIGDIPALSIGEALESITGVSGHRENGGATEVSIRGLGPYLSSTTINGRLVGNGSGNRSVNFSQFPSELVNKLAVFKSQDASQIEGGVAGQIQIDTLKPLDYGKKRIQFDLKGNVNPDQLNQDDTKVGDIGYRGTVSFVDQYELNGLGSIGISVGLQRSDISQPEQQIRATSNFGTSSFACYVNPGNVDALSIGFASNAADGGGRDCEDYRNPAGDENNIGVVTLSNPLTIDDLGGLSDDEVAGLNAAAGGDIVFVPSQRHYRQNDTRDQRDSFFGALQWQPNDRLDINLDAQWSERSQTEEHTDLTINGFKNNDFGLDGIPGLINANSVDLLEFTANGAPTRQFFENRIEVQGAEEDRTETFEGIGLNGSYDVSDRLTVSADFAYSKVERTEDAIAFGINSGTQPTIEFNNESGIPLYTLYNDTIDVNDHSNFLNRLRVRIDNDRFRKNDFTSARFDAEYDLGGDFFTNFQAGFRYAEQGYLDVPGGADSRDGSTGRTSFEIETDGEFTFNNIEIVDDDISDADAAPWVDIIAATNLACQEDFRESSFLSNVRSGDLITRVDSNGDIIDSTSSWGVFNTACVVETASAAVNAQIDLIESFRDSNNTLAVSAFSTDIPEVNLETSRVIDVQEDTTALYAMTDYETTVSGYPVRGNMGLRVVHTEVTSNSYRQDYEITDNGGEFSIAAVGDAIPVSNVSDYTEFLPSANAIIDINDNVLVRAGIFRAISRADPADMGFDRTFTITNGTDDDPITDPDDLVNSVSATGNPAIGPLTSWNYDLGVEWYPNPDSILAFSAYYKSFEGGFENVVANETFNVDNQDIVRAVSGLQEVSQEQTDLFGLEITASHRFSYLPGYLSGLGVKGSYNYVDTDFETEDSLYGDLFIRDIDGNLIQTNEGIVAPGGLPGLSENVFIGTVYYQIGGFDASVIYKSRDEYFQPSTTDGTRLRYVADTSVWEARASYKLNDNLRVSIEGINLFDEIKDQSTWVQENQYEVNSYGPRIFFGIRGKF